MRELLRRQAERKGLKPSRFVAQMWNRYEVKKLGEAQRRRNIAHGTKPKRLWRHRAV